MSPKYSKPQRPDHKKKKGGKEEEEEGAAKKEKKKMVCCIPASRQRPLYSTFCRLFCRRFIAGNLLFV
jgi:hypothetical protein